MYGIECEWDFGYAYKLFKTKDAAIEYVAQHWLDHDIESEVYISFKDALSSGCIIINKYEVIG